MKTTKKLLAILLVVVTVLAISTAVFAQDVVVGGGFGTINVTNTTVGETYSSKAVRCHRLRRRQQHCV